MAYMSDLEMSETWFQTLVHHASDLIVVLEENGVVRYANAASTKSGGGGAMINRRPVGDTGIESVHAWRRSLAVGAPP